MEWINAELQAEHIVVRSLEEDVFDGLILHHLFRKLRPHHLLLRAPGRASHLVLPCLAEFSPCFPLLNLGPSHLHTAPQALWSARCLWLLETTKKPVPLPQAAPGCRMAR